MRSVCCALLFAAGFVPAWTVAQTVDSGSSQSQAAPRRSGRVAPQAPAPSQAAHRRPDITRYSPFAAAGGYRQRRETFWEFWFRQFNPRNVDYGAWLEQRRRVFLAQAGANPYFWFSFWELAAISFLLLWLAKEHIDRKDTEWEAAACLADLANYADYCKRHAVEAIRKHNEHVELCNRVIESAETGRPVTTGSGDNEQWRTQLENLQRELAQKTADIRRLTAELEQKTITATDLSARVDELARSRNEKANGPGSSPNLDLIERLNRATAEVQGLREENNRLKRGKQDVGGGERLR